MSFSWAPFYKELFQKATMGFDSKSLATITHQIFEQKGPVDEDTNGKRFPAEEFEPCSFLARFNRQEKLESRIKYCKKAKELLNLSADVPTNFDGIPTFNNQNSHLFPFKKERKGNEFEILWNFCRSLANGEVSEKYFNEALTVKYTGTTYLTIICYLVQPDKYLPLDGNTRELIQTKTKSLNDLLDLKKSENAYRDYLHILQTVKGLFEGKSNSELSLLAWKNAEASEANASEEDDDTASSFGEVKAQFDKVEFDAFISFLKIIVADLSIQSDDTRVVFSSRQKRLNFTVGQRYALSLSKQGGDSKIGFGTLEKTKYTDSPFNGTPEAYYNLTDGVSEVEKYKTQITTFSREILKATKRSGFSKHDDPEFRSLVFGNQKDSDNSLWMAGSSWNGEDKTQEFVRDGIWQNGYSADSNDPSVETVKLAKSGDWIAIKSSSTKGPGRSVSFTKIKALGRVIENLGDGVGIKVDWQFKGPEFDVDGISYRKTFELAKNDHKKLILDKLGKDGNAMGNENDDFWQEPKNIIYWGPPGTGKTFKLLNLQKQFQNTVTASSDHLVRWVQDHSWWDVIAGAMIELQKAVTVPELFEHELIQLKSKYSSTKTPKNTIWGALQAHTVKESKTVSYTQRQEPLVVDKSEDSKWFLSGNWRDQLSDLVTDLQSLRKDNHSNLERRFEIVTFHQSYSYEEFVEGIRPETSEDGASVRYDVKPGVFRRLCQRAEENPNQQYALFIDEINRGNLSKIFGELITLIESDKRLRMPNEIKLVLPYSGQSFGVPKNLHIIGTMNSVDRSIALVDMALRRRFHFEAIRPDPTHVPVEIDGLPLREVFIKLNDKISAILGSEYQLGHSYFMNDRARTLSEVKKTWFQNILPLLQEYFFDDWEKLKALVGDFVQEKPISGLAGINLPRNTVGSYVDSTVSNEVFKELLRSLA